MRVAVCALLALLPLAPVDAARAEGAAGAWPAPGVGVSPLALAQAPLAQATAGETAEPGARVAPKLGGERARILLQSFTVPGWGQATLGHKTAARSFFLVDLGIWVSFAAFRVQEHLRGESAVETASLFAGIDLEGRDQEYHRMVGSYSSSEEYNRLVIYRDAANLYYDDPVKYREYIAANEVKGSDAWSWVDGESLERYRDERRDAQRAAQRANTALALAIVNRMVSAIHAARYAGKPQPTHAWRLEMTPVGGDPGAFRLGVRTEF